MCYNAVCFIAVLCNCVNYCTDMNHKIYGCCSAVYCCHQLPLLLWLPKLPLILVLFHFKFTIVTMVTKVTIVTMIAWFLRKLQKCVDMRTFSVLFYSFLGGYSPASEFYLPAFRSTLSVPSS